MNAYDLIKTAAELAEVAKAQGYPEPTSFSTGTLYDANGHHYGVTVQTEHKAEAFAAWAALVDADSFNYGDRSASDDNTYAYGWFAGVRVQIFTGALPKPQEPAEVAEVAAR